MAHVRVTVSLPPEVGSDLDWLSDSLGISRSAIVSDILSDAFRGLVPVVQYYSAVGEGETDSPLSRRFRGSSGDAIRYEFATLRRMARDYADPDAFELAFPTDARG